MRYRLYPWSVDVSFPEGQHGRITFASVYSTCAFRLNVRKLILDRFLEIGQALFEHDVKLSRL